MTSKATRLESYRQIRGNLMELMADVSSLTSNINNALQVTEDIFYARIYTRYLSLLRASVWKDNIENKIHVIQRSYTLLNEEVSMYRFELLGLFAMGLLGLILLTNLYQAEFGTLICLMRLCGCCYGFQLRYNLANGRNL